VGGRRRTWLAAAAINLGTLPPPLDTGLVATILPALSRDLHAHITIATWVPIVYLLVITTFMPVFGTFSDNRGRREFFTLGLVVFAVGAYLSGSSQTIYELLVARTVQGVGAAFVLSNSRALISDLFGEKGGLAMGVHVAILYFALLLGPLLGGLILTLTSLIGWRDVFLINVPIASISALMTLLLVPSSKKSANIGRDVDWIGSLILFLGLLSLIGGITMWTMNKGVVEIFIEEIRFFGFYSRPFLYFSFPAWVPAVFGAVITSASLLRESRKKSCQVIPLKLLKSNIRVRSASISILLMYTAHHATWIMMSFYMTVVRGLDPIQGGVMLGTLPLTVLAVSPIGGAISDRFGHEGVMTLGLFVTGVGLLLLSLSSPETSVTFVVASLAILGLGIGTFAAPNTNSALASVDPTVRAQVNGLLGFMRHLGQTISLVLASVIIDLSVGYQKFFLGGEIEVVAFTNGQRAFFITGCAISFVAAALTIYHEFLLKKNASTSSQQKEDYNSY